MKVGLIAMSGTPIHDQGVLNIVRESASLSGRLAAVASLPSLGLLTVAAMMRNVAEPVYLQCSNPNDWRDLPGPFDLVAISTFSAQIKEAYEIGRRYREAGIPVVIGGTHASVLPDEVVARGFIAAIGEAELIWTDIIRDAKAGCLKARYGTLGETCDITASPVPAFELLDRRQFTRIPVQTSRGCPHKCEFCAASVMLSPRYRQKTIEQVMKEIDAITALWKRPFIEFVDDNALVDRNYWKELLRELAPKHLRWFAECDISVGSDPELLELMQLSGCREVLIGLESPAESDVAGIELNNDWKRRSHSKYREYLANIQNHGIRVIGCFMLGMDSQSRNSAELIRQFVNETDLFDVQLTLQTAFPGTPLYARLQREQRLLSATDFANCTLFDLNIVPSKMEADELIDCFHSLMSKLHSADEVSARRRKFKERLRRLRYGETKYAN